MRSIRVSYVGSRQPFQRADVVKHPAPFKNPPNSRYFLVLSDDSHPFHGEEYAVVALTSTQRSDAIEITDDDWLFGGPSGDSYVSPWYVFTIKHDDIVNPQGSVTDSMADTIANEVPSYLGI